MLAFLQAAPHLRLGRMKEKCVWKLNCERTITMTTKKTVSVADIIARIKQVADEHDERINTGRFSSWLVTGELYVGALAIEDDSAAKNDLDKKVLDRPEMEGRKDWLKGKSVVEKLLVATFGYDDSHSKRHYYKRAFQRAKSAETKPTTAGEFAIWVQGQGGLMAAAKGEQPSRTSIKPSEVISAFVEKLPEAEPVGPGEAEPDDDVIDFAFEPEDGAKDLGLFLVRHLPVGKSRVIRTITKPRAIASVINVIDERPSAFQVDRVERIARYELNAFMLKKARMWKKKLDDRDFERFRTAVTDLAADPELREKYFDGEPEVKANAKTGDINTMNEEAHVLDPARYIANAKLFALVPYDLKPDTGATKDSLKDIPSYVRWKNNPPRRR